MRSGYTYAGMWMIALGLFEIFVTPMILQRIRVGVSPAQMQYVVRMIRRSGVIVIAVGAAFLLGFFGRS